MIRKALTRTAFALGIVALTTLIEVYVLKFGGFSTLGEVLMLVLLNLNLLAIAALIFYVSRTFINLLADYRNKTIGYKFRTRVMAYLLTLTTIPAVLLFLVASGLGTTYIDRLFTPDFSRPILNAVDIASSHYEMERQKTLEYALMARAGFSLPPRYTVRRLIEPPVEVSFAISSAFEGQSKAEIVSVSGGDMVRAAIPPGPNDPQAGVIVVETTLSPDITASLDLIRSSYEDYVKLETWKTPLKLNYLLLLGFFTVVIIFTALWVSLKITGWICEPIKRLAGATEAVAAGNLSVSVDSERDDEMGLLIDSFNRMVTELREGKESLQKLYLESDRRRLVMENIVENIQSGVISLDSAGRVLAINSSACQVLGSTEEEVLGRSFATLLAGVQSRELREFIKSIDVDTFTSAEKEVWINLRGRRMLLHFSITGLRGVADRYLGLLIVVDNLTELIAAQRAIAWQEVAKRMAHEIKNPLTPIKLSAERMLKKAGNPDTKAGDFQRPAQTIIREVESLRKLVDEFSKLGKMPPTVKKPTDIGAILKEVKALYKDYSELEISVDIEPDTPPVALDRDKFKRVLLNLFDNATRAMDNSGRIEVRVSPDPDTGRVYIVVADNGPGISDEDKEQLFVPYFSTGKDGTGLGLAIADKIVANHNGHIRVEDNKPGGTVFTIDLPIKPDKPI